MEKYTLDNTSINKQLNELNEGRHKKQTKEKTFRKGAADLRTHSLLFPELHHNHRHSINYTSSSVLLRVFLSN